MRRATYLLVLFPTLSLAAPKCWEGDATGKLTDAQKQEMIALDSKWLKSATFCDFGSYQVLTPSDPKADTIIIFRRGRPFMMHEPGFGINLIQDIGRHQSVPYLSVQDWDKSGTFRRLDYSLVDDSGNVIGNVQDKTMTGKISITHFKDVKRNLK